MSGHLHRLWRPILFESLARCGPVRPGAARSGPVHNSDRQSDLTGLTFTALTPPAALLEVILAVLTPLGRDLGRSGSDLGAWTLSNP